MAALASINLWSLSDVSEISVRREMHLLVRRIDEEGSRTTHRIIGVSGCSLAVSEVDPIVTITVSAWALKRQGLANASPGQLITGSVIANWINGATALGQVDHFGWDGYDSYNFLVRNPRYSKTPAGLHEVSLTLVLECTGQGAGSATGGGNDGDPELPPVPGLYLLDVYTDGGRYQQILYSEPSLGGLFGTGYPMTAYIPPFRAGETVPAGPYEVLAATFKPIGTGSAGDLTYLAGDTAAITGAGFPAPSTEAGTDYWILGNFDTSIGNWTRAEANLVTGTFADLAAVLASFDPPKSESDFNVIWEGRTGTYIGVPPDFSSVGDIMAPFTGLT